MKTGMHRDLFDKVWTEVNEAEELREIPSAVLYTIVDRALEKAGVYRILDALISLENCPDLNLESLEDITLEALTETRLVLEDVRR